MSQQIVVHKLDADGREVWRYDGRVLSRTESAVVLEATFDRERTRIGPITIEPGDRFVETFYADRWFNVFAIHRGEQGGLKGWYVNIARPARIESGHVYQEDLALDLVVSADLTQIQVLDNEEFEALDLTPREASQARRTLTHLLTKADRGEPPFVPPSEGGELPMSPDGRSA